MQGRGTNGYSTFFHRGIMTVQALPTAVKSTAGIDVGAEELIVVVRKDGKPSTPHRFPNTAAGRASLTSKLSKLPQVIVCMEATGIYHLDLAIALHDAGLALMVVNPKAAHHFAHVLLKHTKTDAVDANTLAEYAERMDFVAWTRPAPAKLALRSCARRIGALTRQKAAAKNHLHACGFTADTPQAVLDDVQLGIDQLEQRIALLLAEAKRLVAQDVELRRANELLLSVKGIGEASAVALLGELLLLPPGLSCKQWVKFAGLDPRIFTSGKSVHKQSTLSKAGNRHIRAALYMPALSAKQHDPRVKGYFEHLVNNGKKPMQALCAVMRKLLHAIHGMLKTGHPFDNTRFYQPAAASA